MLSIGAFGRRDYEELILEIILHLDQQFRSCLRKFLIYSSNDRFVRRSGTICAIEGRGQYDEHI